MRTYAYGFPRLGKNREFKKVLESFWKKETTEASAQKALDRIQTQMLDTYRKFVKAYPLGEITGYDQMLDAAILAGVHTPKTLKDYYELCRGKNALEMTKWFNTNYHYLVPNFNGNKTPKFSFNQNRPKKFLAKFKKGIPFLIGPFTFLKLSKGIPADKFKDYLLALADVYKKILTGLKEAHIEEPAFVTELTFDEIQLIKEAYAILGKSKAKISLMTYYDSVDWLKDLYELPVSAIGLDFVYGKNNLEQIRKLGFPKDKILIAGVVDGRNVWKNNVKSSVTLLKELSKYAKNLWVSNACPLYHLPISLAGEKLNPQLLKVLVFAEEKLAEIKMIAEAFEGKIKVTSTGYNGLGQNEAVQGRLKNLQESSFYKSLPVEERRKVHEQTLRLPLFPTTTIGSYPQTMDVRKSRADYRAGGLSEERYRAFIREKIKDVVRFQEELGLDVLVHGEFERTDMVEFFAEKLAGVATTAGGWIISYGSRAYRPPIIFGDVSRPYPMTIEEVSYAQSLTKKPVKGMLTGPVTIIAWSFVRNDIPIRDVANQIALALQDEIRDYEKAGIKIVQIDEPAIREKAPIKRRDWPHYFDWAIKSFRLASNTDPSTQIHTHMCYSEFGEIVEQIDQMDFDVISIETTRSRGDIISSFERINFKKQIGLGVWDIHSPAVPTVDKMREIVQRALKVIPKENFWINPDCGLKTRDWPETKTSLKNLVSLSEQLRAEHSSCPQTCCV